MSAGKVRRVGNGRWTKAKEAIFFEELGATANVRMAAEAAGVSSTAVFARRLRHPVFAAKWNAVLRTARASADFYLVEEMHKTFDPESVETGDAKPRMTIDQAIKISQLNARNAKDMPNPFADKAESSMAGGEVEAIRERLLKKFERLMERERRKALEEGWSYDERHDVMVPPGYRPPPE